MVNTDLQWMLPGGVHIAYSVKEDGDQRDPGCREKFLHGLGLQSRSVLIPRQIHGISLALNPDPSQPLSLIDGVVSTDPRAVIGAYGADCPGLVLASSQVLGIAHCGWRGCAGGIVEALVTLMQSVVNEPTRQWHAFIGPGIGRDHYEVDTPVIDAALVGRGRTWDPAALTTTRPGHAIMDLPLSISLDLKNLYGISAIRSGIDTAADPRLHSYRRHGSGVVQGLYAWRE